MPMSEVQPQFTPIIVDNPNQPLEKVVSMDDFTLTVVSEKSQYQVGDRIQIKAYLNYIGDKDSVLLSYSVSPIHFATAEVTRDFPLTNASTAPYNEKILKKNDTIEVQYGFSGAYSKSDPEEYVTFVKSLVNNSFPKGHYIIEAIASFEDISETNSVPYHFYIDLEFEVVDAEG